VENEIVIYTLFGIVLFVFILTRWFWWLLDVVADELLKLFEEDEKKWWWEKELPQAIGRSGFVTRAALNLLDEEGRLRKQPVPIRGIRSYSLYPRVGKERSLLGLRVQLNSLRS
jgi:hypothetical protein